MSCEFIKKNNYCNIPEDNHIIRYCSPIKMSSQTQFPLSSIFELRKEEKYLSCFWFEFRNSNISDIKIDMKKHLKYLKEGKGANISISILKMKNIIKQNSARLSIYVRHFGNPEDSYSEVRPIPKKDFRNDRLLRILLESVETIYPM